VGSHRLLHSSCCFLKTNSAITRRLIRTAKTLEAECWQVCGEAWVRGQRKISQVLGAFGLLDFIMLRPTLSRRAFWNLWSVYFFTVSNFFFFRTAVNRGYWIRGYGGQTLLIFTIYLSNPHIRWQSFPDTESTKWREWVLLTSMHNFKQVLSRNSCEDWRLWRVLCRI